MSKLIKIFTLLSLVFSANLALADVHLVQTRDANGDSANCIALLKEFNALALKVIPDNHPTVRLIQATFAGSDSGVIWLVVEFDDLADLQRVDSALAANTEAAAMQAKIDKQCPMVANAVGTQVHYHPGTD